MMAHNHDGMESHQGRPMLTTFLSIAVQSIILSCLVSRLAVSPLRSLSHEHRTLREKLSSISATTYWLWLSFLGSWFYVVAVDVLQHGTNLLDSSSCTASIYVCIALYCVSKAAIYMFLTERAHIVRGGTRRQDKLYWFNLVLILGIVVFFCLNLTRHLAISTPDSCIISIGRNVDIAFIAYDFLINVFLTIQFLVPLMQSSSLQGSLRRRISRITGTNVAALCNALNLQPSATEQQLYTLAKRTFIGVICCTLVTLANMILVAIMYGKEEAWICLTVCSGDVLLNCIILHCVSSGQQGSDSASEQRPGPDEEAPIRPKLQLRTSSMVVQEEIEENSVRHIKCTVKPGSPVVDEIGFADMLSES